MKNIFLGALVHFLSAAIAVAQTSCTADVNQDSVVNLQDLLSMLVFYRDSCLEEATVFPSLIVSEIHYNPNSEQGNDSDWEFLELYNPNAFSVSLDGWKLTDAVFLVFASTDSIGAEAFFVVARNADTLAMSVPGHTPIAQWNSGESLNNTGETATLVDPMDQTAVAVAYEDNDGWITEPDGDGPSLELMDYNLPNEEAASWATSFVLGGTPGAINSMWGLSEVE